MTNKYNDNKNDVDNQINKILKNSTPITNLTNSISSSSETVIKSKKSKEDTISETESKKSINKSNIIKSESQMIKLIESSILYVLYIILSSDQILNLFNKYIPNLGTTNDNKQILLGIAFRGLIFVILYLLIKKYIL